ncbi:hypothetical protein IAT40_005462 [Kwoniella sp. CBS 6097]
MAKSPLSTSDDSSLTRRASRGRGSKRSVLGEFERRMSDVQVDMPRSRRQLRFTAKRDGEGGPAPLAQSGSSAAPLEVSAKEASRKKSQTFPLPVALPTTSVTTPEAPVDPDPSRSAREGRGGRVTSVRNIFISLIDQTNTSTTTASASMLALSAREVVRSPTSSSRLSTSFRVPRKGPQASMPASVKLNSESTTYSSTARLDIMSPTSSLTPARSVRDHVSLNSWGERTRTTSSPQDSPSCESALNNPQDIRRGSEGDKRAAGSLRALIQRYERRDS